MTRKSAPPPEALALQGDLDLFSIQAQWEGLRTRLTGHRGPIVLDLAGVGDIDLSGIQLLLALQRHAASLGTALRLTGVQPGWIDRFRPLGLAALLEGPP